MPTLEITQELLDQLNSGESITIEPPKKKIELELLAYSFNNRRIARKKDSTFFVEDGRYRDTKEACELAQKRMNKTNRLSQLAHQLGGEREFVISKDNYYIYYDLVKNEYDFCDVCFAENIEKVCMTEECAEQICEILNNGEFEL